MSQVAKLTGYSARTVRRKCVEHKFDATKWGGGHWKIFAEQFEIPAVAS